MHAKPIVVEGHTLALLHPEQPHQAEILRASVLMGSPYPAQGIIPLAVDGTGYRDATPYDFETFNVHSKGYFPDTSPVWLTAPPEAPGWYARRALGGGYMPKEVQRIGRSALYAKDDGEWQPILTFVGGFWAGPFLTELDARTFYRSNPIT